MDEKLIYIQIVLIRTTPSVNENKWTVVVQPVKFLSQQIREFVYKIYKATPPRVYGLCVYLSQWVKS